MAPPSRPLTRNPISLIGAAIVTMTAFVFLLVFLLDVFGMHTNPYLGLVFFVLLPALFVAGLVLIPIGMLLERRRIAAGRPAMEWPRVDLNVARHRRVVLAVAMLTLVNALIVSLAAYRGMEFMDSPAFCGQVCHRVMEPEFVAYKAWPHAQVPCVDCHVGPGPQGFLRAKLNGTRQLISLARGTYPRPVPSPVHNLRPARETCEQCHWSEKFHGDKTRIIKEYSNDEANTESVTRLLVHVGGGSERSGLASGIHWHMNIGNDVEYVAADAQRQVIPFVRLRDRQGNVREYRAPAVAAGQVPPGERRHMDCVDCHNRPSHSFYPSAERAVDTAMGRGEIPRTLPFARREAIDALKQPYPDRDAAASDIARRLRAFYGSGAAAIPAGRSGEVDQAVAAAQRLYAANVFPGMKVVWGSHLSNLGHTDAPGCFRCHDDLHKTADGRVIKQDCDLCHDIQQ
ncbi:MAG: NapC/NirT family cytochrome c [Vicinamibacterales bacterium]